MKISYKLPVHSSEGRISKSGGTIYLPVRVVGMGSSPEMLKMSLAIYPGADKGEGLVILSGRPEDQRTKTSPLPEGAQITIEV